jgi:pimeloyl-ACP methyl ester carboxylesterase
MRQSDSFSWHVGRTTRPIETTSSKPSRFCLHHLSTLTLLWLVYVPMIESFSPRSLPRNSMGAVHKHRRKFALFSTAVRKLSTMGQACVAVDLKYMDFSSVDVATYTPVILLHGLLGSKRNFSTVAQSLAVQLEKKRRIVGLDLRNHGTVRRSVPILYS